MKNFLLFAFLVCIKIQSFSQKTLVLKNLLDEKPHEKYQLWEIKDGRKNKHSIGFYIDANKQKNAISILGGIEESLEKILILRKNQDSSKAKIQLHLKNLEFSEKQKTPTEIAGELILKMSFEKITTDDTIHLVDYQYITNFVRNFSNQKHENYEAVLRNQLKKSLHYFEQWFDKNETSHEAFIKKTEISFLPDLKIDEEDTLSYGIREINWDDFKGKPSSRSLYSGAIFPNIGYSAKFFIEKNTLKAQIQTHTYMVKGMSWIKINNLTDYALNHEKLHFSIAKIIIERFKKKISTFEAFTVADLQSMIQLEYIESYRAMNRLQEEYDHDTQHGLNRPQQSHWEQKIKEWL
jgi:hypothetical protein